MIGSMGDWLNERVGYRPAIAACRARLLPDGPSWWAATGSLVLWLLVVEAVTGVLLMATYSPSFTNAWASVHYIESSLGGRIIRGVHHWGTQALFVALIVHLARCLLVAAFRAPRELIWITGVLLLPLTLAFAITGNPLVATQSGVAQIEVESNIAAATPGAGPLIRRLLLGGDAVGHLTLTHLYTLHSVLLPTIVLLLCVVHFGQIYRHLVRANVPKLADPTPLPYWPYQSVRNLLVLLVVLGGLVAWAYYAGAPLTMPADPEIAHTPRPEWYVLFLFEARRYFSGTWELLPTQVFPALSLGLLLVLPWIDARLPRSVSFVFRALLLVVGLGSLAVLTGLSLARDAGDKHLQEEQAQAQTLAARARLLADAGLIPPEGAIALLRRDALTQGPVLFKTHCGSCHAHTDAAGAGLALDKPQGANLYGFGTTSWLRGLFDPAQINTPKYFGGTPHASGDMATYVEGDMATWSQQEIESVALALEAEAQLPESRPVEGTQDQIEAGRKILADDGRCAQCHKFYEAGSLGSAPDLTGYASRQWMLDLVCDPGKSRFYGDLDHNMPAFAAVEGDSPANTLSRESIGLIVDWLRRDWYRPTKAAK
ncbi:MAG: cytochrome b N-terminal domain-containing protein [Pirellulales bacterium]|nr:cytochrome b N-terminal domain-containing protein [Pirellulales bacterium]